MLLPFFLLAFLPSVLAATSPPVIPSKTPLLTLNFPPTAVLPNPQSLPAFTHATLSTANLTLKAPFRRDSTFIFTDVPIGTYLGEIHTGAAGFNTVPLRVDVTSAGEGKDASGIGGGADTAKEVKVWQTFRANDWENKGQLLAQGDGKDGVKVDVQVISRKEVYEIRAGFSPLSLLKNPMVLIGIVGLGLMFGMPKLMENMDPELREEFEKQQKSGSGATGLANALTGQGGGFDAASWLAGAPSTSAERRPSPGPASGSTSGASSGSKGGKRRRG